jgi:hypothetical protein
MVLDEVTALHISTSGMDAHTWVVFAIALGPSLVMMVVVALRIRQDAREDDLRRDDLRETLGTPGSEGSGL